jgi:hypothetical protein
MLAKIAAYTEATGLLPLSVSGASWQNCRRRHLVTQTA